METPFLGPAASRMSQYFAGDLGQIKVTGTPLHFRYHHAANEFGNFCNGPSHLIGLRHRVGLFCRTGFPLEIFPFNQLVGNLVEALPNRKGFNTLASKVTHESKGHFRQSSQC